MRLKRRTLFCFSRNVERLVILYSIFSSNTNTVQTLDRAAGPNRKFLLTIACPAGKYPYLGLHTASFLANLHTGPQNFNRLKIPQMTPYLDFYNLMAYDYAGSWDTVAGHQANVYPSNSNPASTPFSTVAALLYYTETSRVPRPKMVLGMPLYGRAFTNTDGPGTPFSGVGEGSWENGVWDYKALPRPGASEQLDQQAMASWCYDPAARTMVSYDTVPMGDMKVSFIEANMLGGAMWWDSSGDKGGKTARRADGSLIGTFVEGAGGVAALEQTPNALEYPESQYDNLRAGFP